MTSMKRSRWGFDWDTFTEARQWGPDKIVVLPMGVNLIWQPWVRGVWVHFLMFRVPLIWRLGGYVPALGAGRLTARGADDSPTAREP